MPNSLGEIRVKSIADDGLSRLRENSWQFPSGFLWFVLTNQPFNGILASSTRTQRDSLSLSSRLPTRNFLDLIHCSVELHLYAASQFRDNAGFCDYRKYRQGANPKRLIDGPVILIEKET